jgi:uncharacterized RDD family membrane protein YckC
MPKASPNKRVSELMIDLLIVTLFVSFIIPLLYESINRPISLLLGFIYLVFRDSFSGRSVGKLAAGLRAVDLQGNPISYLQSVKRNIFLFWPQLLDALLPPTAGSAGLTTYVFPRDPLLLTLIGFLILCVEYILAAYRSDGRRLGDRFAKTQVIDLRPAQPGWLYLLLTLLISTVIAGSFHNLGWLFR